MCASDSPFVADWFIVSLRWLVLLGLIISLSLGGQLLVLPNALLIGLAGWNIALTLLAGLNRSLARHREISLGVGLLVAGFLFSPDGRVRQPRLLDNCPAAAYRRPLSVPGKGTRVQVYISLTEEAADRLHHPSGKQ